MKSNSLQAAAVAIALGLGLTVGACKQEPKADAIATEQTSAAQEAANPANTATPTPVEGAPTAAEAAVPSGPVTNIQFDETTYNYGKIKSGTKATHIFKFKNTGEEPLIINNAQGSCGCTVPEWPKEPIAPGKSGEIKVTFDSTGKSGVQSKRVTLTANTNPAQTFLTIEGEVEAQTVATSIPNPPAKKG